MKQSMQVQTSMNTVEWYTPPFIIELARQTLGEIELDPASNEIPQTWIKAKRYYSLANPAREPWQGKVWLNPPFDDAPLWSKNLEQRYVAGAIPEALLLVNAALGYIWFEELYRQWPCCLLQQRTRFIDQNGKQARDQAKKASAVLYFGNDYTKFGNLWSSLGRILLP